MWFLSKYNGQIQVVIVFTLSVFNDNLDADFMALLLLPLVLSFSIIFSLNKKISLGGLTFIDISNINFKFYIFFNFFFVMQRVKYTIWY